MQLGSTMIYVTHDQIEAMTLADRIAVMNGGVIQQLAPPKEIYNRPVNRFVAGFVGSPAMNFFEGAIVKKGDAFAFDCDGNSIPLSRYFAGRRARRTPGRPRRPAGARHARAGVARTPGGNGSSDPRRADGRGDDPMDPFGEAPLTVRVEGDSPVKNGDQLNYSFDIARASLFDKASGARL